MGTISMTGYSLDEPFSNVGCSLFIASGKHGIQELDISCTESICNSVEKRGEMLQLLHHSSWMGWFISQRLVHRTLGGTMTFPGIFALFPITTGFLVGIVLIWILSSFKIIFEGEDFGEFIANNPKTWLLLSSILTIVVSTLGGGTLMYGYFLMTAIGGVISIPTFWLLQKYW